MLAVAGALLSCRLTPREQAPSPSPPRPEPASAAPAHPFAPVQQMLAQAPGLDPAVLQLALNAQQCAVARGAAKAPDRLAVIDYTLPSTEPRLWIFDLRNAKLLFAEHVAHGKHSGENLTNRFSNLEGSLQSSLGLFTAGETYQGENGYSLRMDGLEPGVNDRARERLLVMHGADYVDPQQARRQGRLGRSWGCPAVRRAVAHELIDSLKEGQLVFAYYPDSNWLSSSRFLRCNAPASAASKAGLEPSRHTERR
ncbi:MAG: murein L,D-transpeptidase catalytic domain family protein [Lysobacter sp.]